MVGDIVTPSASGDQQRLGRRRRRDERTDPPYRFPDYRATLRRAPTHPLVVGAWTPSEWTGPGPALAPLTVDDADLTRNAGTGCEAIGERIIVTGRVTDERGIALPNTVIEIWQANAAGRYLHERDDHDAPLDPNFTGVGRCRTDASGIYRILTIRPGAYPWPNGKNTWRPSHIHLSLLGPSLAGRLVTQMYFPGDPLLERDSILQALPGSRARAGLVAAYDHEETVPGWALGYRFDIVLRASIDAALEPREPNA